jgi:hypothetical protein
VYWALDKTDRTLRRKVYDVPGDVANIPHAASAAHALTVKNDMQEVTKGCLHFGVWLVGSSHNVGGTIKNSIAPSPNTAWTRVIVPTGGNYYAEPIKEIAYDTRTRHSDPDATPLSYPSTVRFTLLLTGNNRKAPVARLRQALSRQPTDYTEVDPTKAVIPIAGVSGLASRPGSFLLIEDTDAANQQEEIIGYHGYRDGRVLINTDPSHGPLNKYGSAGLASGNGRAVLRSEIPSAGKAFQPASTRIRFGRFYTLVKSMNR